MLRCCPKVPKAVGNTRTCLDIPDHVVLLTGTGELLCLHSEDNHRAIIAVESERSCSHEIVCCLLSVYRLPQDPLDLIFIGANQDAIRQ